MPKPNPPRRKRSRSGAPADAAGVPAPGEGLGPDAAAAAEAAAEAEAAWWSEASGGPSDETPGWFRDEALGDVPGTLSAAPPGVVDEAAAPEVPGAVDAAEVTDAGDTDGALPPATIYRTVPPLPEDAALRPHRRSPLASALIGLLILMVVGAGGFGIGMLLPLLIPLPAGAAPSASPAATDAGPSATPEASASASPAPSASPPASPTPSPAATPLIYVVKRGDQLGRIAASFGVTLEAIQAANGITNPNLIIPGQKLVIPAPVASPGASPSAAP